MANDIGDTSQSNWMDTSGVTHLLRAFKIAVHPSKLVLALGAIALTATLGLGLDAIWNVSDKAVPADELARYVGLGVAEDAPANLVGIFGVFSDFQLRCVRDAVESVREGRIIGAVDAGQVAAPPFTTVVDHPKRGALTNLLLMGRGVVWMMTQHGFYAVLFLLGGTLIWALFGGAMCRMAAVQIARDESIGIVEAFQFAKKSLFGGFFLAPVLPLFVCLLIGLIMSLGGVFLRIPWLGDVLGGLLFFLALIGGFLISLLLIGLVGGGSLFWPTIAVEDSDCFDAVSRSVSYVYGRPLRATWYALVTLVFGSFCWLFVRFVIWLALRSTHLFVGMGSGLFFEREGVPNKLSALWSPPTFENLLELSGNLSRSEGLARGLIGLWVLVVVALSWAFLASFYLSASTIVYFLLRRDVDGTDLGEVHVEEDFERPSETSATEETPVSSGAAASQPEEAKEEVEEPGNVSLPIIEGSPPAAAPATPPVTQDESKVNPSEGSAESDADSAGKNTS